MYIYIQEIRCSQIVMGDHWQGEPPARRAKTNGPPTDLLFFFHSTHQKKSSNISWKVWFVVSHIYIYIWCFHMFSTILYQECWGDDDPQLPNQDEEVVYGDVKEYEEYEEYEEALSDRRWKTPPWGMMFRIQWIAWGCSLTKFAWVCTHTHIYIYHIYDII